MDLIDVVTRLVIFKDIVIYVQVIRMCIQGSDEHWWRR